MANAMPFLLFCCLSELLVRKKVTFDANLVENDSMLSKRRNRAARSRFISHASQVVVLLGVASCLCLPVVAQQVVKEVLIRSEWAGHGIPPHRESLFRISITASGAYQSIEGKPVELSLINQLAFALQEVPRPTISVRDLGIDEQWLKQNVAQAVRQNDELEGHENASARQRTLFKSTFENPRKMESIISGLFAGPRHTDDNPFVEVAVTFEGGSVLTARSNSQHEFMLPWRSERGGKIVDGFNRDISRAIVALMPEGSTNRERLSGEGLREMLGTAVMEAIQNEWNLIEVEETVPSALDSLRGQYEVLSATISGDYALEYGREWRDDRPQETNLIARLSTPLFPARFDESAVLEQRGSQVIGVNQFLKQAGEYERLSLSVPWLGTYRQTHDGVAIHLYYVHNGSLAERSLKVFRADMQTIGSGGIANQVGSIREKVALLVIDENNGRTFTQSHWIVLPDRRMILWRFRGPKSALVPFGGNECSREDPEAVGGCVGRVKLANGQWQQPTSY